VKILVTGGTGFVGWHIVRAAVTAGHEVVSLSRGVQRGSHVYPVRNVHIDLVRPDGLLEALAGVGGVVHAAGILREQRGQDLERAHVGATANLVEACRRAGVGKIVHLSTLGVHARAPEAYLRSKWEAERIIESCGLSYTIFRPSLVFGAGDRVVSQLLTVCRYSPLIPLLGDTDARVQPIWVGDVATAVLRALKDRSTDGSIYELGGPEAMTIADVVEAIKRETKRPAVPVKVPRFLSGPLVRLGEQLFDRPPVTEDQLALLSAGGTCDPNPAAVTFGLRMRALADVLPEYDSAAR
jgi:NADH dehydrogenase